MKRYMRLPKERQIKNMFNLLKNINLYLFIMRI